MSVVIYRVKFHFGTLDDYNSLEVELLLLAINKKKIKLLSFKNMYFTII